MKTLNDLEVVNQICKNLGSFYSKAISLQRIGSHTEALLNYRSALSVLLSILAERNNITLSVEGQVTSIHEDTETLVNELRLSCHVENTMAAIRIAGNKGCHADKYPEEDFKQLSQATQNNFIELIQSILSKYMGLDKPAKILITNTPIDLKELAYLALCEDDDEAAYLLANHLITSHSLMCNNTVTDTAYLDPVRLKVIFLLRSCYRGQPAAAYCLAKFADKLGVHCIPDYRGISAEEKVVHYLLGRAANFGEIRAEFEYGVILLDGECKIEPDAEYGLELLKRASAKGEARASIYLALHYDELNESALHEMYLKLGAEQGLPISKVEYAKYIMRNHIWEKLELAETYLEEAYNEGEPRAICLLANFLQSTPVSEVDNAERILSLYEEAALSDVGLDAEGWWELVKQLTKLKSGHVYFALLRCKEAALKEQIPDLYLRADDLLPKAEKIDFTGVKRNDLCPCESGKKFKTCCLPKLGNNQ